MSDLGRGLTGAKEEITVLIKDKTGRIEDIEKTVKKFGKHSAEFVKLRIVSRLLRFSVAVGRVF